MKTIDESGVVKNRKHQDIVDIICPRCGHDHAFLKHNVLGRYKCAKCGHYWK